MTEEEYAKTKDFYEWLKTLGKCIDKCYMQQDGTLMLYQGTLETFMEVYKRLVDMRGNDK